MELNSYITYCRTSVILIIMFPFLVGNRVKSHCFLTMVRSLCCKVSSHSIKFCMMHYAFIDRYWWTKMISLNHFYTKSVLWNLTSFRMWMTPSVKIINSVAHLNFTTFLMILYFTHPSSPPSISAFTVSLKIAEVKSYSTHSVDDGTEKCSSSIDYNRRRPGSSLLEKKQTINS